MSDATEENDTLDMYGHLNVILQMDGWTPSFDSARLRYEAQRGHTVIVGRTGREVVKYVRAHERMRAAARVGRVPLKLQKAMDELVARDPSVEPEAVKAFLGFGQKPQPRPQTVNPVVTVVATTPEPAGDAHARP